MERKSITISDIAKRAGVSKTTVSRYLNGKFEFMSQQTREKIFKEISEAGFRPNRLATSLKTDCSGLIGVVMSDIMSSQTPHLLGSICDTCTKYGKKVVVVNSENDPQKERQMALDLLDQRVEGLLVISGYNSEFYQSLNREKLPVVLADRVSGDVDLDSVVVNHTESTRRVVKYLLSQGYQRLVVFRRPHVNPYNTPAIRADAASAACEEFFGDDSHCIQVQLSASSKQHGVNFEEVSQVMEQYYENSREIPTAIFVSEKSIMLNVICSFYRSSMKRSHQFTIAGYSDESISNMFVPPICTIEQPLERMGQLAVERLLYRIKISKTGEEVPVSESSRLSCRVYLGEQ